MNLLLRRIHSRRVPLPLCVDVVCYQLWQLQTKRLAMECFRRRCEAHPFLVSLFNLVRYVVVAEKRCIVFQQRRRHRTLGRQFTISVNIHELDQR